VSENPRLRFVHQTNEKRRSQAHGTVALSISIARSSEQGLTNNTAIREVISKAETATSFEAAEES
jgi:hypothetical protein